MSLATLKSVQKLQKALHVKAKESPDYRFYSLYDKVHRLDVLTEAYARCRANRGAAGVDGQTFQDIEKYGVERWLGELAETLATKRYRPEPVRRVNIPKPDGTLRPLGIPTIQDRVVQMAVVLLLDPILEADLPPEQYAYRSGRSAHDAITQVMNLITEGYRDIVDADLRGYFDSIPHAELMRCVARRVNDGSLLHLIKMWLASPVEDQGEHGIRKRTTVNRDTKRGVPQGAPISPLLANWYMRRFVLGWKTLGHATRLRAKVVNYADDFVICCRGTGAQAMATMRSMMTQLKLTINDEKTRRCRSPKERFDFLGYTIGRQFSPRTGVDYLAARPSHKALRCLYRAIKDLTSRQWLPLELSNRIERLNRLLVGWANYFCLGTVRQWYTVVDQYVERRLRGWLRHKHAISGSLFRRYPSKYLYGALGLVRLGARRSSIPWAKT
jgi:group II intron reverse transcriptase/maturase